VFENSYKIRVSSRAIIIRDEKILLCCFGNGLYYSIPGGGIEEAETAKQAVIREVLEETGLAIEVGHLVFSLESHSEGHHISFFFRCYVNQDIAPVEPSHTDTNPYDETITLVAKWMPLSELHEINLVPRIQESLIKYVDTGVFIPAFWDGD